MPILSWSFGSLALALGLGRAPELHWSAPAECPDERVVTARLGDLLSSGPSRPATVAARVEAVEGGRYRVELRIHGPDGESARTLVVEDCELAAGATALIAAVALDPGAVVRELEEPPEPEAPIVARSAEPPPDTRWRVGVSARADAAAGAVPGLGLGSGLGVALLRGPGRVELAGTYFFPRTSFLETPGSAGGRFSGWLVALRGCYVVRKRAFELPICGAAEAGAMHGSGAGRGVDASRSMRPWVLVSAGTGAGWVVHPSFVLGLELAGFVTVLRPQFGLEGVVPAVYHAPLGGARAAVRLEVRFR
jgi:hypothetical protein